MVTKDIRKTSDNKLLGVIRIVLGFMFIMTGVMKLFIPTLTEAWLGQLTQAGMPFVTLTFFFVPVIEIVLGLLLVKGFYTRFFIFIIFPIMFVAIYVHFAVDDPALFPLQPKAPIIPFLVLIMAGLLLWGGGGSWSADLRWTKRNENT